MAIRHVILDRDGVLNREAPDAGWIHRPEDWVWEDGAVDGLSLLARAGLRLSVVTNQSGVGRGLFDAADVEAVHDRMLQEVERLGVRIDAVFVCPHAPEDACDCRKPLPGLMLEAIQVSGLSAAETIAVGDALRDLEAATAAGIPALLVRTGKGRITEARLRQTGILVFDNLKGAAEAIVAMQADQPPERNARR
jgi:D-glycero-D-manno-heptose 1,7-bisphosphate phosphatase